MMCTQLPWQEEIEEAAVKTRFLPYLAELRVGRSADAEVGGCDRGVGSIVHYTRLGCFQDVLMTATEKKWKLRARQAR